MPGCIHVHDYMYMKLKHYNKKEIQIQKKSGPAGIWNQDLQMLYQLSYWSQVEEEHFIDNVHYLDTAKFSWVSLLKLFHWSAEN